ncbi:ribosomal protein S5 domain 2-type protein [Lipomyces tetrasporus]|uniref:Ribosomal RNA-processing protein 41 n=1 Tax=Lipomyces tetrasporus TaxID=54092 RepID=A0AAD7QL04_9ASCO|nr:ribosomal protein S5 domain 2-type protein [Lipomyces tetrasporus]KAJ8097023.1 ribosomal protein S5 domain 2-type protein [Lipomyces tetrasporus]
MASRLEIFSPEGLRIDGRRWNEVRHFRCAINTHPVSSDGSAIIEQGNTKVICNVIGPVEPTLRSRVVPDRVSISVKVVIAPFSTIDRRKRSQNDSRMQEMCSSIQHVFEDAVIAHLFPRSQIDVNLYVVAQDGGVMQACINATTLALIDAGVPMYDYVCACTAGMLDREVLLDLNRIEESDMPFLTMATIGSKRKVALLQLEMKVQFDRLEPMMAASMSGCHHIRDLMDNEVRKHGKSRLERGSL